MPNVEIKAKHPNLARAREIAVVLGAKCVGLDHQIDTYFKTPTGRLKLRESSLSGAQLIPYVRDDQTGPKKSNYAVLPVPEVERTKQLFAELLGVEQIVEKHREIFLLDNVRIHLDDVKGLGTYFEFEAVYTDDSKESEKREHEKVRSLLAAFEIDPDQLLTGSYRELVGGLTI